MANRAQSFDTHKRYYPLFHFIAFPLLTLYAAYALYALVRAPSLATAAAVVLGAGLLCALFASRLMVLVVQNRVIRLEMWLRLERLLGPAAPAAIAELSLGQLLALRFAPDAELLALVERARTKDLATGNAVKRAIRDWQPDFLRA
jgi:hypothetical protein